MGCLSSKEDAAEENFADDVIPGDKRRGKNADKRTKTFGKPIWKTEEHMTVEDIKGKREVFWDTQPHYGGSREIWDALKGICETEDMETVKLIIESAGIIVAASDMTICYDERGAKYELPKYVLSLPSNVAV